MEKTTITWGRRGDTHTAIFDNESRANLWRKVQGLVNLGEYIFIIRETTEEDYQKYKECF